ncbi:MAG: 50S ribosomal protein L4 [Bacilli bacterium]
MAKTSILNLSGEKVKDLTLNDSVWNIEVNEVVLTDALNLQMASLRQGTAKVKNRSEVSGGGRKPWKQKGTGRARQGSTRSPQWRHGGIVFGPTPRSYSKKQNRKERVLAIKSALSSKFQNNELVVVNNFDLKTNKTKDLISILENLKVNKALFVISTENENLYLASRNNEKLNIILSNELNILEIIKCNQLVIDEASVKKIEEVLG